MRHAYRDINQISVANKIRYQDLRYISSHRLKRN